MMSRKDLKNPWVHLWIIGTILLYWFFLYHVVDPFNKLMFSSEQNSGHYPLLFVHHFWILFPHIIASIIAALIMPWQFLMYRSKAMGRKHRTMGKICFFATCVGAPTAIYLSYTSDNGFLTSTGNAIAASGWCFAFWIGYYFILQRNIKRHIRWMIRCYAFFLGAAVLRVIYTEMEIFSKAGSDNYTPEAWLAWALPWFVVEFMFFIEARKKKKKRNNVKQSKQRNR